MREKYGADRPGVFYPASNVWPLKLVTRMFQLAEHEASESGIVIHLHTHTTASSISPLDSSNSSTGPRWSVETNQGILRTRFIMHATNGYASYLLPHLAPPSSAQPVPSSISQPAETQPSTSTPNTIDFDRRAKPLASWIAPTRGQIIATRAKVPPSQLWRCSWLANWGYEYWFPRYWFPRPPILDDRTASEEKALVILGGARDVSGGSLETGITDDSTLNPFVSEALREFLPSTFPGSFDKGVEPDYEWVSGIFFTEFVSYCASDKLHLL